MKTWKMAPSRAVPAASENAPARKPPNSCRDISPAAIANSRNGLDETCCRLGTLYGGSVNLGGKFVTEQHRVTPGVECIAMKDAMGTEIPNVTGLRHARLFCLKARNVVVGIRRKFTSAGFPDERKRLRAQQSVSIDRIKTRDLEIEFEIGRQQLL